MPAPLLPLPAVITAEDLVGKIKQYFRSKDLDLVWLAYEVAESAHRGQTRKSGEPYITHPLAVAYILASLRIDLPIVIAALLHDVPEDTAVTLEEIEKNFGADVASMIRGITKLGKLKYRGVERYIENLRKMFVAMAEDVRVMIIKFADRVHNLLTLEALEEEKRYRVALESLEIFAPIANRLGMGEFKGLLEDLSFPWVYPKEYERVKRLRDELLSGSEAVIESVLNRLREELTASGIRYLDIHGRKKQLYSFYQKLLKKEGETEKIYDIIALRIIVPDVSDCYAALGVLHKLWRPLKGRIKDYIAQPKPNGYQSLHTTVFCANGQVVEFQIRTLAMHQEAEYGVAAHWHYDEGGRRLPSRDIGWAKELARIQQEVLVSASALEELKVDFFRSRIFVFTPAGDVIDLPEDATPVDFAYHIHSEVGNTCTGTRVNDQLVGLDTLLKSGDVVEIITDKNRRGPSPDWLKIAKTHVARSHIKSGLKRSPLDGWIKLILPKRKRV
ncbi:MAG: bifunctional (p)ppGpp synthetase/guanosine-3',5'-bis(diphosphate) 3'-pyrophosphohydrolase [Candidatus Magasanikbacteria bacterium]|nr:bifunctional (p)ppGpp synthetase/guanosine-3',5'-bis(diphosphate) 3'-pyrophosphohydrolase [Candidatus Magasanikbacteria bacterium]